MISTDLLILKSILHNKEYLAKIVNVLSGEFFTDLSDKKIADFAKAYYAKYTQLPTYTILKIWFEEKDKSLTEKTKSEVFSRIEEIETLKEEVYPLEYLLEQTEDFFKAKAVENAILEAAMIYEKEPKKVNGIPELITKALQVTIDLSIGHDYSEDAEKQWEYYNQQSIRHPTHLANLNNLIGGGFMRKTLNVFLGQPCVGKSRMLVDLGVHYALQGLHVLYVTLELSENVVRHRCDANLLDIDINSFDKIQKEIYLSKIKRIKSEKFGKFIIKEYPPETTSAMVIDALIGEVRMKRCVVPDVLIVDYLGIMAPAKNLGHNSGNIYVTGKTIANELRALAMKHDCIVLSAAQLNREGWYKTTNNLSHVAESAGIAHVSDVMISMSTTEDLLAQKRAFLKILKNRLFSMSNASSTIIGFDDSRMRHFDVEGDGYFIQHSMQEETSSELPNKPGFNFDDL